MVTDKYAVTCKARLGRNNVVISSNSAKIMVVEDNIADIESIKRVFKKCGLQDHICYFRDGHDALALLKGYRNNALARKIPQIMLIDINLPQLSGFDLLKEIRDDQHLNPITVFMISSSDNDEDVKKACKLKVSGYIIKPFSPDEFLCALINSGIFWFILHNQEFQCA